MQKSEPSPAAGGNGKRCRRWGNSLVHQTMKHRLAPDPAFHPASTRKTPGPVLFALEPPHAGVQGREGDTSPLATTCHHPRAERQESQDPQGLGTVDIHQQVTAALVYTG